jgi:glycosyltransferase involved in cell wall biosynthesis
MNMSAMRQKCSTIKVTVGMCAKNSERTIKDAIQSVFVQDYPHEWIEFIIVDGHSQDSTMDIINKNVKTSPFDTRVLVEEGGLAKSRQAIVDVARGRYIMWVDSDMILSPSFVRKHVELMDINPRIGIAKGKYRSLTSQEGVSLVATLEDLEFQLSTMSEGKTDLRNVGISGCAYRTKAIREVGGFDVCMKGACEDADIESRITRRGWLFFISSAVFCEKRRETWRDLWKEYSWHGRGSKQLFSKNEKVFDIYKMLPPVAMLSEMSRVRTAYKLTRKKVVLLLPLHYLYKRIAWVTGFIAT